MVFIFPMGLGVIFRLHSNEVLYWVFQTISQVL